MDPNKEEPQACPLDTTRPPDYTMTFTRYKAPLPTDVLRLDTNAQIRAAVDYFLRAGTDTCFDEVNGGYYMLAMDGTVLGVVSDAMCAELDARQAEAARWMEEERGERLEGEGCGCSHVGEKGDAGGDGKGAAM